MSCLQSGAPLATETMTAELSDGIPAGSPGYFMGVTTLGSRTSKLYCGLL